MTYYMVNYWPTDSKSNPVPPSIMDTLLKYDISLIGVSGIKPGFMVVDMHDDMPFCLEKLAEVRKVVPQRDFSRHISLGSHSTVPTYR